jgi:hypothetical protein
VCFATGQNSTASRSTSRTSQQVERDRAALGFLVDQSLQLCEVLILDATAESEPYVPGFHRPLDLQHLEFPYPRRRAVAGVQSKPGAAAKVAESQGFGDAGIAIGREIPKYRKRDR